MAASGATIALRGRKVRKGNDLYIVHACSYFMMSCISSIHHNDAYYLQRNPLNLRIIIVENVINRRYRPCSDSDHSIAHSIRCNMTCTAITTAGENTLRVIDRRCRTLRGGRAAVAAPTVRRVALFWPRHSLGLSACLCVCDCVSVTACL